MKLLLDTHAVLWLLAYPDRITKTTRRILEAPQNTVMVSIVSLWEIAIKQKLGKLDGDIEEIIAAMAPASKLLLLDLRPDHLLALRDLPAATGHRDPFDHLLIAQCIADNMTLVSKDAHVPRYPVELLTP